MSYLECSLVNTWGIMYNCDIYNPDENNITYEKYLSLINWDNIKPRTKLYIGLTYLKYFVDNFLHKLKVPIFLITGHGDDEPSICKDLIEDSRILHWFSQNSDFEHPKMTKIPIGLDYHTLATSDKYTSWGDVNKTPKEQEIHLLTIASLDVNRQLKCYSNFRYRVYCRKYTEDRIASINQVPEELVYYEPEFILRIVSWLKQLHYQFVLSPNGNGLDCHRTYEALTLGCYPIIKSSPIDSLFDDLPVLIVKEWSDVSLELLKKTSEDFKNKQFNMDKLSLYYWNNLINSYI